MTPVQCQVSGASDGSSYGDCVRACVATILDLPSEVVPHFYHDGDGDAGLKRMREWLSERDRALFIAAYAGQYTLYDVLTTIGAQNPDATYMLFGATASGENHCVVCQGDKVVWNPSWGKTPLVRETDAGVWVVGVIAAK